MPAASSILLGAGLAASLGSGVAGAVTNMSAQQRAQLLQDKGVQEWLKVNVPDPEQQKIALDQFTRTGKLTPELEQAVKPLDSQFNKIQSDPRLKESRMRALSALEQQGYGGEQVQDRATRQEALIDSAARSRGQQEAITSSIARRGQLGGGSELAARLSTAQADADRNAKIGLDSETQRRQRMLQSIAGAGDLAGNIQNQNFQQAAAAAQAQDAINMFNTQNTQNVANRNINRNNEAQTYNLNMDQDVANRNVGLKNYEQEYNKELLQQQFQNQAAKAGGIAGQYGQQANQATQQGQSAANMWGGVASGAGSLGLGAGKILSPKSTSGAPSNLVTQQDEDDLRKVAGTEYGSSTLGG